MNPRSFIVPCLCVIPLGMGGRALAQSFTPLAQSRSIDTFMFVSHCQQSADIFDQAIGFEPFSAFLPLTLDCALAGATSSAGQQSQIDPFSMTASGDSSFEAAASPMVQGLIIASGNSLFNVTFDIPATSPFTVSGMLSANGFSGGGAFAANATMSLTGPGNQTIFTHTAGSGGKGALISVAESGVLQPGNYVLQAGAFTILDDDVPPLASGQAHFDLVFDLPVPCSGDITPSGGNGVVDIDDLVAVLNAFGPCPLLPLPCEADIAPPGGNSVVNIDDLVAVLNGFGICP